MDWTGLDWTGLDGHESTQQVVYTRGDYDEHISLEFLQYWMGAPFWRCRVRCEALQGGRRAKLSLKDRVVWNPQLSGSTTGDTKQGETHRSQLFEHIKPLLDYFGGQGRETQESALLGCSVRNMASPHFPGTTAQSLQSYNDSHQVNDTIQTIKLSLFRVCVVSPQLLRCCVQAGAAEGRGQGSPRFPAEAGPQMDVPAKKSNRTC